MFGISSFAEAPFASLSGVTIVVALTGVAAIGSVGNDTAGQPLTFVLATGNVGSVGVADREIALTGVSSSGLIANLAGGQPLTGVQAAGSVGTVIAIYWKLIDDSQTANWQNITSTQGTAWSLIESDEPTAWELIDTTP
jgi:hypothetical protein